MKEIQRFYDKDMKNKNAWEVRYLTFLERRSYSTPYRFIYVFATSLYNMTTDGIFRLHNCLVKIRSNEVENLVEGKTYVVEVKSGIHHEYTRRKGNNIEFSTMYDEYNIQGITFAKTLIEKNKKQIVKFFKK